MNEKQIKRHLEDRGLMIKDLALDLVADHPHVKFHSAYQMLLELIGGRKWYPIYAEWLKRKHKIAVDRPPWTLSARERRMKLAA